MKKLDLYSEAKPPYYQLIPNREDGLMLLALYQKEFRNTTTIIKKLKPNHWQNPYFRIPMVYKK